MTFVGEEKAEAALVGQVMILAISVIGISTLTLYSLPMIDSLQDMANVKNVEQSLTVLESRVSRAILGDSLLQVNSINLGGGTLKVEPNSTNAPSYIVVNGIASTGTIKIDNTGQNTSDSFNTAENLNNFLVGSGTNRLLVVGLSYEFNPGTTNVKYNNINLTRAMRANNGIYYVELWYLVNPPSGSYTIAQTQTIATKVVMGAWSYTGVDQVTPIGNITNATGSSTTPGVNITTTAANSVLVDVHTDTAPAPTIVGAGQTPRYINETLAPFITGGGSEMNTTTIRTYNMNWTLSEIRDWVDIAAEIKPVKFTIPMGKVTYTLDDRIVAYEGGGVWSKYPSGRSVMLSPPQLYFNGVTLSLPVINISGNTSVSGEGIATISFTKSGTIILYPNTSMNMINPVNISAGKVYVNITSDFYEAWAEYAEGLGYGTVGVNPTTRTTSLELSVVPNNLGEETSITNPVVFRGLNESDDTPLDKFSFRLVPFGNDFDWDIRASSGKKKLIFHIKGDAGDAGDKVDLNIGYQDDGLGYDKPAETWEGKDKLIAQQAGGKVYLDVDLLNTSLNLTYKEKTVGAEDSCTPPDKIQYRKFNNTGFSWNLTQTAQQNMQYVKTWTFAADNESWKPSNTTTTGTVTMSHNSTDGNSPGSLYAKLTGSNKNSTTTWTSPNFTWNNGTPVSARLDFDWKVATYRYAKPGSFYVALVKPDGSTSQIYPNTTFNTNSTWSPKSNTTVSVSDFTDPGNYSLKLVAELNTDSFFCGNCWIEEVGWDNPTITLNYTGSGASQSTNKSLYDITQHYFNIMAQAEDGTITFYQCSDSGKEAPAAESTVLMDYFTPGGLTYMQISDIRVDAGVS